MPRWLLLEYGVGQYQHDVNQNRLKESLDKVVESCVNFVGVDVNAASKHLLTYVSGLSANVAKNIVEYRAKHGSFKSRDEIKKVPLLGAKAFEQSAGFLRIQDAVNPLDNSAVHPESYHLVESMAAKVNSTVPELIKNAEIRKQLKAKDFVTETIGEFTITDILKELEKPATFPLKRLIKGWQTALPQCRKGGKILILLPSHMAYSIRNLGMIPPNSVLQFEIEVVDIIKGN